MTIPRTGRRGREWHGQSCGEHIDHAVTVATQCGYDVELLERAEPVAGQCTACGSVEVALVRVAGVRDLSGIGESAEYPTGYGCEVCS